MTIILQLFACVTIPFVIKDDIRAMVLAAGIGSRLQPLSDEIPKPLIQIGGNSIMGHILHLLKKHGITQIISNTHHLADRIHSSFADIKSTEGIDLSFVYEEKLSGVAGGIRRCQDFLKQSTACIIMGDALTDIDLTDLYYKHKEAVTRYGCLATVAQMQVSDTRHFGVIVTEALLPDFKQTDSAIDGARIVQFQEKPKPEEALSNWANTGVYFFEPEIYNYIPSIEEAPVYDVAKDLFPRLLREGKYIQAIAVRPGTYWADLGTPQQYIQSLQDLHAGKIQLDNLKEIDPSSEIAPSVTLIGANQIGKNCKVEDNVSLENCIIWDNAVIGSGSSLKNCILGENARVAKNSNCHNEIIVSNSGQKISK